MTATTEVSGSEILADGVGTLATPIDALRQYAVATALAELLEERRQHLRAWIAQQGKRPGWKAEGDLGSVHMTKPGTKAIVTDADAWEAFCLRILDEDEIAVRPGVDWQAVEIWLDGIDPDSDDGALVNELLDRIPGARTTETILPAGLAEQLAKDGALEDGRVVYKPTGEIIDGLAYKAASNSTPGFKVKPEAKAQLLAQLGVMMTPIDLDDQEEG